MHGPDARSPSGRVRRFLAALLLAALPFLPTAAAFADTKPDARSTATVAALDKPYPEGVEDLRAIQSRVKEVIKKVSAATVGLRVGGASGSGVIIDKEGHVLTAGHVSGRADRSATIILPDGKRLKGKTLSRDGRIDSGLIKITEKGEFPYVEMGKSADLKPGQWCLAIGHPGGFRSGRTPVVRLGRIQQVRDSSIRTDCVLVGGDSGGPLFDLNGRVIGIHSRIGGSISANIHVPVDTYRDNWTSLVYGLPYIGIEFDRDTEKLIIRDVNSNTPAEKAGLKENDLVLKFAGKKVESLETLGDLIRKKRVGDKVTLEIERDGEKQSIEVVLGKRDD